MLKSATWEVRGIAMCAVYQVISPWGTHIVDFLKNECTCRQWQLSGIPCGHVCAVCRVENLTTCNKWAKAWFTRSTLKGTYAEMVFPLDEEAKWHNPGDLQTVKPPLFPTKQSGRPKEPKRFLSKNEDPKSKVCGRCGVTGHNRDYCMAPLPNTQVQ